MSLLMIMHCLFVQLFGSDGQHLVANKADTNGLCQIVLDDGDLFRTFLTN